MISVKQGQAEESVDLDFLDALPLEGDSEVVAVAAGSTAQEHAAARAIRTRCNVCLLVVRTVEPRAAGVGPIIRRHVRLQRSVHGDQAASVWQQRRQHLLRAFEQEQQRTHQGKRPSRPTYGNNRAGLNSNVNSNDLAMCKRKKTCVHTCAATNGYRSQIVTNLKSETR